MIRNPSDGTTYDPPKPQVTGLPELETGRSKDEIRRLEESREWLKNYSGKIHRVEDKWGGYWQCETECGPYNFR